MALTFGLISFKGILPIYKLAGAPRPPRLKAKPMAGRQQKNEEN